MNGALGRLKAEDSVDELYKMNVQQFPLAISAFMKLQQVSMDQRGKITRKQKTLLWKS